MEAIVVAHAQYKRHQEKNAEEALL